MQPVCLGRLGKCCDNSKWLTAALSTICDVNFFLSILTETRGIRSLGWILISSISCCYLRGNSIRGIKYPQLIITFNFHMYDKMKEHADPPPGSVSVLVVSSYNHIHSSAFICGWVSPKHSNIHDYQFTTKNHPHWPTYLSLPSWKSYQAHDRLTYVSWTRTIWHWAGTKQERL